MKFRNYQKWVRKLWSNKTTELDLHDLFIMTAGLGGETGEVLEILKKAERSHIPPDLAHLTEELGDVLYYLTMLCNFYGLNLKDVIEKNVEKIDKRYGIKNNEI
jgi:NTP pyrophosphatase (non-canonical NTP hydrolase)